jgi:hypothetical protein
MRFPVLLHGVYADVLARCRVAARQIGRGESVAAAAGDDWSSPHELEGLVVLHGPSPLLADSAQLHAYLLLLTLEKALASKDDRGEVEQRVFEESLEEPWSLLGLMSFANQVWLYSPARHLPFLRAVSAQVDDLLALDGRYSAGSTEGAALWDIPSNIKYVLANVGVGTAELQSPKATEEIRRLLQEVTSAGP